MRSPVYRVIRTLSTPSSPSSVPTPLTLKKLLIANRGEIACRIMDTAHRLGVPTVASWVDADKDGMHVRRATQSVRLGASPSSYLDVKSILARAQKVGADSVHPGYGFLSEDAKFASAVKEAGLVWVGPSAYAMETMGQKDNAKLCIAEKGVPLIPGYHGKDQSVAVFLEAAATVGYPVIIKAAFGGGGKGMRVVRCEAELPSALLAAQSEAAAAFGESACVLEKLIESARHVEVQVFGDKHGNVVHLFERDCSAQRRHQKLLEEAPAPGLSKRTRELIRSSAVAAARSVHYEGAGTVEFLVDSRTGEHYFLEMNTRLQVEHCVTEMLTGLDLVEWQLRVACGEPLPLTQDAILSRGEGRFAMEARICAEGATREGFTPSAGKLISLELPPKCDWLRIDKGVEQSDSILPFFDSLIAKIICASSVSRDEARSRLDSALEQVTLSGVSSNVTFLRALLNDPTFKAGTMTTDYVEKNLDPLLEWCNQRREMAVKVAVASLYQRQMMQLDATTSWGTSDLGAVNCDGKHFRVEQEREIIQIHGSDSTADVTVIQSIPGETEKILIDNQDVAVKVKWDLVKKMVDVLLDGRRFSFPFDAKPLAQ